MSDTEIRAIKAADKSRNALIADLPDVSASTEEEEEAAFDLEWDELFPAMRRRVG